MVKALRVNLDNGGMLRAYSDQVVRQQARASEAKERLDTLIVERDALQNRMRKVFEVIEQGGLAAQAGRARLEMLQDQLNRLVADIAGEEATVSAAAMGQRELSLAEMHLRAGIAALESATAEERATVLRGLVSRITATREKANLDLVGPGSHSCLEWLPGEDSNL